MFPWSIEYLHSDGSLYAQGCWGLNLCRVSAAGAYSAIDDAGYKEFIKGMAESWPNQKPKFTASSLRFYNVYAPAGKPFRPVSKEVVSYTVRGADCDLYSVLYQGRVPSMMESCKPRYDATGAYVSIRTSVRPGDALSVHVFSEEARALFICLRGREAVLVV
eukprot:5000677-Amphidinium_carterae.1